MMDDSLAGIWAHEHAANDGPLHEEAVVRLDAAANRAHARAVLHTAIAKHAASAITYAAALMWAGATGNGRGVRHHLDMLRAAVADQSAALAAYERGERS